MPMNPRLMRPKKPAAAPPQPQLSPTLLLMHFDDENQWLLDSSPYNRQLSTYSFGYSGWGSGKFGAGSVYTNGDGAILPTYTFPDMSTTDHTIECWIQVAENLEGQFLTFVHLPIDPSGSTAGQHFYYDGANLAFSDGIAVAASGPAYLPSGQWYHVAAVQQGPCKRVFLDGTLIGISVGNAPAGVASCTIGAILLGESGLVYNNTFILDELRITSRALYCANFTPPIAPFSEDGVAVPSCGPCCPPAGTYLWDGCDGCDLLYATTDGQCGETVAVIPGGCC